MPPHCPVIFELLSGSIIVIHSAIALWITEKYYVEMIGSDPPDIFIAAYDAEREINGFILPLLM